MCVCVISVSHAEGQDKEVLDKKTEGFLHQNIRDIKQAQVTFHPLLQQSLFSVVTILNVIQL